MLEGDRLEFEEEKGRMIPAVGASITSELNPDKIMIICSSCNSFDEFT